MSAPDPTSLFKLFGLIPWDAPMYITIGIRPIVMGLTLCHQQKIYDKFLSKKGFKNSNSFITKIFSLPMYVELTDEEVNYICDCLYKL